MEWKPIDTAPKDGSLIDVLVDYGEGERDRVTDVRWGMVQTGRTQNGFTAFTGWLQEVDTSVEWVGVEDRTGFKVTHWMPQPSLQKAATPMDWRTSPATGLEAAIAEFKAVLPGWWFSVGECQVSADASCGPTRESEHIKLVGVDRRFDDGFHADLPQPNTMADALVDVMQQALAAIKDTPNGH